jgi:hypothetical protein
LGSYRGGNVSRETQRGSAHIYGRRGLPSEFARHHTLSLLGHRCPNRKNFVSVGVNGLMTKIRLPFLLVNTPKYRSACTPTTQQRILAAENALMTSRISSVPWPPELGKASPGVAKMVEGSYMAVEELMQGSGNEEIYLGFLREVGSIVIL